MNGDENEIAGIFYGSAQAGPAGEVKNQIQWVCWRRGGCSAVWESDMLSLIYEPNKGA